MITEKLGIVAQPEAEKLANEPVKLKGVGVGFAKDRGPLIETRR
jgi:hypothetical protein